MVDPGLFWISFSRSKLKSFRMLELCWTASMVKLKSKGHLDGALTVDRAMCLTVLKNPFQSPVKKFLEVD